MANTTSRTTARTGSGWPFVAPFLLLVVAFLIVPTLYGVGLVHEPVPHGTRRLRRLRQLRESVL